MQDLVFTWQHAASRDRAMRSAARNDFKVRIGYLNLMKANFLPREEVHISWADNIKGRVFV